MKSVRLRLEQIERTLERKRLEKELHFWEMAEQIQAMLDLPLPDGSDLDEALRRFKAAIDKGTAESMGKFRDWVGMEKQRILTLSQPTE